MYHLKKIIIEGFKSKDCTIEYTFKDSNFTIVFGENGCGKTTLLQIIHAVFACDESVLVDNQVKKIILIVNCDGVECAVTVCENTFTEEFNTRKKHYNWEEFNKYNLSKIRTGFLSVERCGNGFLENETQKRCLQLPAHAGSSVRRHQRRCPARHPALPDLGKGRYLRSRSRPDLCAQLGRLDHPAGIRLDGHECRTKM